MRFETYTDPYDADQLVCVVTHHSKFDFLGAHESRFKNGLNVRHSVPKRITGFQRYVKQYVRRNKERSA